LNVARHLLAGGLADQIIFLPAARSPHKLGQNLASPEHRLAMVRLALADEVQMSVSDWELQRGGVSYTIHAVRHFTAVLGAAPRLILGLDSLTELHRWYEAQALVRECQILLYGRPGWVLPPRALLVERFGEENAARLLAGVVRGPELDISSSQLRALIQADGDWRRVVPEAVAGYIAKHGLYRSAGAAS
jgi:nicotinate-nucleotide adenylyltransferase